MILRSMHRAVWVCFGLLIARTACAGVVYSQSSDYPNSYNALTSQSQSTGGKYQAYDNFSITSVVGNVDILAVTFQGFYWNPTGTGGNPVQPPLSQNLQVGFYTNVNNLPGTLLGQSTLTGLQSSFVGSSSFGPDNTGHNNPVSIYNFAADLSTPIQLSSHTEYWFSVVSFASTSPDIWLWTSSFQGDGKSAQRAYTSTPQYTTRDRAFSLLDTEIEGLLETEEPENPADGQLADLPEPASFTLLAIGLACTAGARFRRRQSHAG